MIIYKATNKENGKIYIGQTVQTLKERNRHRTYGKTMFDNAYRKYGEDGFIWEIIDTATNISCLNRKESYWIETLKSTDREIGYNLQGGGFNAFKTEEVKRKIGDAQIGEKNHMYGKTGEMSATSKKVINLETGEIYHGVAEAIRILKMDSEFYMYNSCNGKCSSIYGQRFRYLDEQMNYIPTRFDAEDYKKQDHSVWCLNDEQYYESYAECALHYGIDRKKIISQANNINKKIDTVDLKRIMRDRNVFVRNCDYIKCLERIESDDFSSEKDSKGLKKSIKCIDDGQIFNSIVDAVKYYNEKYPDIKGISRSTMSNHLNKGSKFRFANLSFSYCDDTTKPTIRKSDDKVVGVFKTFNGKFKAWGMENGKQTTLGTFINFDDAVKCRLQYELETQGRELAQQKHLFKKYKI